MAERTFELTEFLVHVLKIKLEDLGDPIKVTWHSSCQAKREMGIGDSPKQLLRQLKNVELIDINSTPIKSITEKGLSTTNREFDFDILIFSLNYIAK